MVLLQTRRQKSPLNPRTAFSIGPDFGPVHGYHNTRFGLRSKPRRSRLHASWIGATTGASTNWTFRYFLTTQIGE